MPGAIKPDHQSTMTFPLRPSHPALRGVEAEDLKFWRGDHLVTTAEPPRPDAGGARAIIVSGSAAGIDHAPLLEQFIGSGCIILSQLRLVEKWSSEPTAARILANLLSYLDHFQSAPRKMAVMGGNLKDVYWLGEPGAMASTTPRAEPMADGVFTRSLEGKPTRSYEIEYVDKVLIAPADDLGG